VIIVLAWHEPPWRTLIEIPLGEIWGRELEVYMGLYNIWYFAGLLFIDRI
jgi:hypothetical protein